MRCTRCLLSFPSKGGPWVITARPRFPELGNARTAGNRGPLGSRGGGPRQARLGLGGLEKGPRAQGQPRSTYSAPGLPAATAATASSASAGPPRPLLPPAPFCRPPSNSVRGRRGAPARLSAPLPSFLPVCQFPRWSLASPHLAPSRSSGPSLAWASCSPADGQRSRPWEPIANHENPGPGDPKGRGRRREPLPSSDRDVLPAGPPSPHHTLGEARLAPVRSLQSPLPNS